MINRLFGKHAALASLAVIFIVGGLTATQVVDPATGALILAALGVHAATADSAVK